MSSTVARSALASLPRALKISPSTPITRTHLLALYKEQLRVANSFSSYNFRQYFVRRTKDKFRLEVPALLDAVEQQGEAAVEGAATGKEGVVEALKQAAQEAAPKEESPAEDASIYSPTSTPLPAADSAVTASSNSPQDALREWYTESLSELAVLARSAIVNQMYEAPRLVVEGVGQVVATGGGGAGQEAR
ncbi:hypothetical protein BCR35DRAFT_301179 [Leucosporidium creatinivorum]|uniref:Complex 1 LYR protein domain-containing protein n=1 Tax=Leucosporidium creatinivorum TaxID=106004 RepID=A0A1Y2G1N7_9BASI|nr:hypothetical protein BCR35DRAFT_301179 [Leucosporidium creatinivorum]